MEFLIRELNLETEQKNVLSWTKRMFFSASNLINGFSQLRTFAFLRRRHLSSSRSNIAHACPSTQRGMDCPFEYVMFGGTCLYGGVFSGVLSTCDDCICVSSSSSSFYRAKLVIEQAGTHAMHFDDKMEFES